jgi:hypothetical protein
MSGAAAAPQPTIDFFACLSDVLADQPLPAADVSASKGVLRSDKERRVLTRVRTADRCEYVFVRMPLGELVGKTAYDVLISPEKGRFRCFACLPHGPPAEGKLRLTLESYGAWPDEGAPKDKLINVTSQTMWPLYLQA